MTEDAGWRFLHAQRMERWLKLIPYSLRHGGEEGRESCALGFDGCFL